MGLSIFAIFTLVGTAVLAKAPARVDELAKANNEARVEQSSLFDGQTLDGWMMGNGRPITTGWEAVDGVIHLKKNKKRTGYIVSRQQFGDFKLSFEWAIAEGGNSGLKYRVRKFGSKTLGCEYQIYDDVKRPLSAVQSTASLYAVYEPNEEKQTKPPGEFNTAQIIVRGNSIEHWLNGKRVVSATTGTDDWDRRVANSKFSAAAGFGENRFGRFMLTDHGSEAWYRNFKLELFPIDDLQGATELTAGEQGFIQAMGRDCPVIRLWPAGQVPAEPKTNEPKEVATEKLTTIDEKRGLKNLLNVSNVSLPSMLIMTPPKEKNTGAAIVLCPGGGYRGLVTQTVKETTAWLNEKGIAVVLLKYRVPRRGKGFAMNHQPMQDAQRAMGILRARAKEWDLNPTKIGIGGFSAGGHLAATLAINHQKRWYEKIDVYDDTSCRPDFAVLLYPAYLTDPIQSRERDGNLHYDRISKQSTPPTLLAITRPDIFTVGAVEFYLALMEAKVSAELHIYPVGGHGGAIKKYPFGQWATECFRFLGDHGIITAAAPPAQLEYKAKSLPELDPNSELTLGDQRLRQILGRDCPVVPVWPHGVGPDELNDDSLPEQITAKSRGGNALNIRNVSKPTLTIVRPLEKSTGQAMIVCPGGAYTGLAAEHEGTRVCEWLNELGITGILLKYRVPSRGGDFPKHHHALQDLQRAIRLVRARADEWGVDPNKLGVCGFSAGGHLATTLCTNFEKNSYPAVDDIDNLSSRPDFALLVYPAYLTEPRNSNELDSNLKNLKRDVLPPMFMTVARDDVFARGMLNFFLEVRKAGVSAEGHVYAGGGHGGGIDPIAYPSSQWTAACTRWLKDIEPELERLKKMQGEEN